MLYEPLLQTQRHEQVTPFAHENIFRTYMPAKCIAAPPTFRMASPSGQHKAVLRGLPEGIHPPAALPLACGCTACSAKAQELTDICIYPVLFCRWLRFLPCAHLTGTVRTGLPHVDT